MPALFTSPEKFKVIEYGQHANDDLPIEEVKQFFCKILKFKAA